MRSLVFLALSMTCLFAQAKRPNIIMILAGDMGYGDLGCTGSQFIKTSNIDSISALDLSPTFMAAAGAKPLPLKDAPQYEDQKNRKRAEKLYGAYDGQDLLPILNGSQKAKQRTFFWRLQGQSAILSGDHKLIKLSHRPAQLFAPGIDPGERSDLTGSEAEKTSELFRLLGEWENSLATVPLWDSSPFWSKEFAQIYDTKVPIPEPK